MDEYSYNIANKLLNNIYNTNTLEINFSNMELLVHKNTTIAVTGAVCEFYINDISKNIWQTFNVKKGDIIKIGKIIQGLRVYLSVKDGFNIKIKHYDINKAKLKKGDKLDYSNNISTFHRRLKKEFIPQYNDKLTLRVMLSYQKNEFLQKEKDKFFSSEYIVSNEISRMGYKLKGESIKCKKNGIISEGIAYGSIQIPNDGQPIILLKDKQTIGGYPKIGVVLDVDCFKLSQAKINTKIKFEEISIEKACSISKEFHYLFF